MSTEANGIEFNGLIPEDEASETAYRGIPRAVLHHGSRGGGKTAHLFAGMRVEVNEGIPPNAVLLVHQNGEALALTNLQMPASPKALPSSSAPTPTASSEAETPTSPAEADGA